MYFKLHHYLKTMQYFTTKGWVYSNHNTQRLWNKLNDADKKIFPLSMTDVLWSKYMESYVDGIRTFLLKDKGENQIGNR